MNLLLIVCLLFLFLGAGFGSLVPLLFRVLRRRGAHFVVAIDPMTENWWDEWRRPQNDLLKVGYKGEAGRVPLGLGKTYTHRANGRRLHLVDGNSILPLTVTVAENKEAVEIVTARNITLNKDESRAVSPNGKAVEIVCRDQSPKQFADNGGWDIQSLAWVALIGLAVIVVMVGFVIVKLGSMSHSSGA